MWNQASRLGLALCLLTACKNRISRPRLLDTQVSERSLPIAIEMAKLDFPFCPTKKSFSLNNSVWLSYLASIEYGHFKDVGPALEQLGFGGIGEGRSFLKKWYELRIKRLEAGIRDVDDPFTTAEDRIVRKEQLLNEYKQKFGQAYLSDKKKASDFEQEIVGNQSVNNKIRFMSGISSSGEKGNAQAFYAENEKLKFSIIAFRGREISTNPDQAAELGAAQTEFTGLGKVHKGMFTAFREIEPVIMKTLNDRSAAEPLNLWITGHGEGAGLATLLTARILMLQKSGDLPKVFLQGVYHFGSPRVFHPQAAQSFDNLWTEKALSFTRFRNSKDVITGLPISIPGRTIDYWHVGALAYIDAKTKLHYGNAWDKIEKETDYLNSFPSLLPDHEHRRYFQLLSKNRAESTDKEALACDPVGTPLQAFKENLSTRR